MYEHNYTKDFDTLLTPLPEVAAYDSYFVDTQYGLDPYWGDEQDYPDEKEEYRKKT